MIDWEDMVKEYKKQYDDEDGIHEFIDSLLPVYYGDIYSTYHEVIGTPMNLSLIHISEPTRPERIGVGGVGV